MEHKLEGFDFFIPALMPFFLMFLFSICGVCFIEEMHFYHVAVFFVAFCCLILESINLKRHLQIKQSQKCLHEIYHIKMCLVCMAAVSLSLVWGEIIIFAILGSIYGIFHVFVDWFLFRIYKKTFNLEISEELVKISSTTLIFELIVFVTLILLFS